MHEITDNDSTGRQEEIEKGQKTVNREAEWFLCPSCKQIYSDVEMENTLWVCNNCEYHFRIPAIKYLSYVIYRHNSYKLLFENILPADPLNFMDMKSYTERLKHAQEKTGLTEAIVISTGKIGPFKVIAGCMDFDFLGGSMGSVVGERIYLAFKYALSRGLPVIMVTRSGGARMMESVYSLMQLPKTLLALHEFNQCGLPYIVVLTDPTTGGVTASFGMMGDIHIAEKGALIGFAGPRVIKETTKLELPPRFQTAEYLLQHGFVDIVVDRRKIHDTIITYLKYTMNGK